MATTSLWKVKKRLDHIVDYISNEEKTSALIDTVHYVSNEEKTEDRRYVTCINCNASDPYLSMMNTKKMFKDNRNIVCFHGYQSFAEGEGTPSIAHEIGVRTAKEVWGSKYEVIVTTHLNTDNLHNHFVVNATSYVDGKRFCNTKKDLRELRRVSDELCREYQLSVIEEVEKKQVKTNSYQMKRIKNTMKKDIELAIDCSLTPGEFCCYLRYEGYEVKQISKDFQIQHPKLKEPMCISDMYPLDEFYDKIYNFQKERIKVKDVYERKGFDIDPIYRSYRSNKLTGLQRLVLHYQYILGIYPVNNTRLRTYSKELKEVMKELDVISDQTIMMCKNNIHSIEDLSVYEKCRKEELEDCLKKRSHCYNKVKKHKENPEMWHIYKQQSNEYTEQIKALRKQVRLCDSLRDRTLKNIENFKKIERRKERGYERY